MCGRTDSSSGSDYPTWKQRQPRWQDSWFEAGWIDYSEYSEGDETEESAARMCGRTESSSGSDYPTREQRQQWFEAGWIDYSGSDETEESAARMQWPVGSNSLCGRTESSSGSDYSTHQRQHLSGGIDGVTLWVDHLNRSAIARSFGGTGMSFMEQWRRWIETTTSEELDEQLLDEQLGSSRKSGSPENESDQESIGATAHYLASEPEEEDSSFLISDSKARQEEIAKAEAIVWAKARARVEPLDRLAIARGFGGMGMSYMERWRRWIEPPTSEELDDQLLDEQLGSPRKSGSPENKSDQESTGATANYLASDSEEEDSSILGSDSKARQEEIAVAERKVWEKACAKFNIKEEAVFKGA
jgi:hypothetical protein